MMDAKNIFALYDGTLTTSQPTDQINVTVSTAKNAGVSDFTVPGSGIVLGIEAVSLSGGTFDPSSVRVTDAKNNAVAPIYAKADVGGAPGESLTLVSLAPNVPYHLQVSGQEGMIGAYEVKTFLAGDANGDGSVNTTDLTQINNLVKSGGYLLEGDSNLDHSISAFDYTQARANNAASTTLRGLPLSQSLSAPTVSLAGGILATAQDSFTVSGATAPGARVSLEVDFSTTEGQGVATLPTVSADSAGHYSFSLPAADLPDGFDTIRVQSLTTDVNFLQRRQITTPLLVDTQGPLLSIDSPTSGAVTKSNLTIKGMTADGGSGLPSNAVTVQVDGGAAVPLTLDSRGDFQVPSQFKLDTTNDGLHTFHFTATDKLSNSSTADFKFTLDTTAPTLSIASPLENGVLAPGTALTGVLDGTGSLPGMVSYRFDGGASIPVSVSNGAFSQVLDQSGLSDGAHVLVVTANDQAGNVSTRSIDVTAGTKPVFTVVAATPLPNAGDQGVTIHPQIFFSEPVDPSTLTSDDLYATFGGQKLAANIVASSDGTFAWLFFTPQLPDSSQIRITVEGSKIHPMGDASSQLDAMNDGMPGSVLTYDFKTVSTVSVANTTLSGIIADPGPDLQPMTGDDYVASTMTATLPIAHVKIYVVGDEQDAVYTDANGYFHLASVPIGDVKIAVDGTTASDPPAGYYFPVMVMDGDMAPGKDNTIMPGMEIMWQPRVASAILHTVSGALTTPMTITSDANGAPGLTPEQRSNLSITLQPGGLVGADGKPVSSAQVGISVVPPELVMDMLPDGVLQHSFDITVQAIGATNFTTPAPMTFPNVFNDPTQSDYAAPGSKLYFLSFDHNTGRLVIEGTATVSADGLSVTTDPGTGITHPGWHGLVPPGTPNKGPGPQPPPCLSTTQVVETVIDLGTQIAQCAAGLAGLTGAVNAILDGVKNAQGAIENGIKTYNEIVEARSKGGSGLTCATITDAVKTINNAKGLALDVASLLSKDNPASPISKGLAISKCIENLLSVLGNLCGRVTSTENPCNTIITRTVCLGIDAADTLLAKVNALIENAEEGLGKLGLALICTTANEIASIVGDGCALNGGGQPVKIPLPSPGEAGVPTSGGADSGPMGDSPAIFTDAQLAQLEMLFQQITGGFQGFVANIQPSADFLNATLDFGQGSMNLEEGTQQLSFQAIGAKNAYYLFDYVDGAGNPVQLRGRADDNGQVNVVLPPSVNFTFELYDFRTDRIASYTGTTAASGQTTQIPLLTFNPTTAVYDLRGDLVTPAMPHSHGNALADEAMYIVGLDPTRGTVNTLTNGQLLQVQEGLDPTGAPPPIGILGTVSPLGGGSVQDVVASANDAYIATGTGGVQVVDITKINQPTVIASVPASALGGDALAVAFTSIPDTGPNALPGGFKNLVAAAIGGKGLAVIDVTDPPAAKLLTTIPVPGGALSVQIVDNLAYVGGHGGLVSVVDMVTDQLVTTFNAAGGGDVTAVKFSDGVLYTLCNGTLAAYDVTANLGSPSLLSSIDYSGAVHLFVGTGRAYVSGQITLAAVDITDPTNLRNSSGAFLRQNYSGVAVNGSGALVVGSSAAFNGIYLASLFDVTNPDDLNTFVTQFSPPGSVQAVWIQNGLALLADGDGGLAIFNYQNQSTTTTAPAITIGTTSPDGQTVAEGSRLRVDVSTADVAGDQTRSATLTVNGVTYQPVGSYPFTFFVDVPAIASKGAEPGASSLTMVVEASDTAGNTSTKELDLTIVQDTTPPRLNSVLPANGHIQFNAVQGFNLTFTKALDPETLTTGADAVTGSIHLIKAGPDGLFTDGTVIAVGTITFRTSINMLTIAPASPLGPGKYELVLDESMITDRAGNPLGTGNATSQVTVEAIPFDAKITGDIASPGQVDLYSFQATAGSQVTLDASWFSGNPSLSSGHIALVGPGGITVLASGEGFGSTVLGDVALPTTGLYTIQILAASANPLAIGNYSFTISDPNPAAQTIAYGQVKSSQIAVLGDDQHWQFQATAGDLVNLAYSGPTADGITVYNPDGTAAATLPGGSSSVLYATPVTQTGTYTFVVDDDAGDGVGQYSVRVDQGSFMSVVAGAFDAVQAGSISPAYAVKEYRYTLHAGDVTTIFADLSGMAGGTVHLLDAATGLDLVPSKTGYQAEFSRYVAASDGDILVEILGATGSGFNTGSFTLTVSNPSQATQTLPLGGEKTGTILVRGDDQPWQFTSTAPDQVVTFGYRGPGLSHGITILNPDGTTLATLPAGGSLVARDLDLHQVGTYHFTLSDDLATGAYTLDLSSPSIATKAPTALAANAPTGGTISPMFDVEPFSFTASAGQSFSVLVEWSPGGSGLGNGEMDIYTPGGVKLATASGGVASSIPVLASTAGTYLIQVRAASGSDFRTGAFRITAYAGAEVPTNDTLSTAASTGITAGTASHYQAAGFIGDNIYGVKDVDIYAVSVSRGDQIAVTLNPTAGSDLSTYIRLFDAGGAVLASNGAFGQGSGSFLAYTSLTTGTYYVGVSSSGDAGYDPTTAGSGVGSSVGGYQVAIDTSRDYTGPKVIAVNPTGTSSRSDITAFSIGFNKRLLASTATDATNYQLVSAGIDGVFGTGDDSIIATTPSYNDSTQTVTLGLASALPFGFSYALTIKGTGTMPITDIAGNPLDNGGDEVRYLTLSTATSTPASFPFSDGFESGGFGTPWVTSTTSGAQIAVTSQGGPHAGAYHVQMGDSGGQGRAEMTLSVDLSGLTAASQLDLGFWHKDSGYYSMPAQFSGEVNADGVAISEDGVNWYRVVDLGSSRDGSYAHYVADLKGTLLAAGLPFPTSTLQVKFEQYLFGGETAYFDDVQLNADLAGPTITSVSTPRPLVFSNNLNAIVIDFSKALQSLSAGAVSSYELTNQNGSPIVVTPTYNDAAQEVTLAMSTPLAPGSYTLRINGNPSVSGTTQIRDSHGNLLNNGVDSVYSFTLFNNEATTNDEIDQATATGLTSGSPQFSTTTAIGNNTFGPRDVDLYQFSAKAGDRLTVTALSQQFGAASLDTLIRLFDANGNQIAVNDNSSQFTTDSQLNGFEIPAAGTYYVGVSSARNATYNPLFSPSGLVGQIGEYALSVSLAPDTVAPTIVSVAPHAGPNVSQTIQTVVVTFSEPVVASQAADAPNYSLTYLGPDGVLGTGDDRSIAFTAAYSAKATAATLTLTAPGALLPLPIGSYELVVRGTPGHITDLAGNALDAGVNFVEDFNVIGPENPLNDRMADAYDTGTNANGGRYTTQAAIGDNAFGALDVDFYKVQVNDGLRLSVSLADTSIGSPLVGQIRVFDSSGQQIAAAEPSSSGDASLSIDIATAGTYFVAISGRGNDGYNPFVPGSGSSASTTGEYVLTIATSDVVPPVATGISTPLISVDPALNQVAVTFSKSMDLIGAGSASSYSLISSGPDRIFGDGDDVPLAFSVLYNVTTHQATLTTSSAIPNGNVELILHASGLKDRGGLSLNGGADQTFTFSHVTGGASLPAYDGFESGVFGPNWVALQGDPNGLARVSNAGGPRQGSYDLLLASNANYYNVGYIPIIATATLAVQTTAGSALQISFYEKRPQYEYAFQLPASFTGNASGDGVSISTDGQHWYRVVDLSGQGDAGIYDRFTADLAAAAQADGLALGGVLLVRFSNTEYYQFDGSNYGRFFDDIRVAAGPTAPVIQAFVPSTFLVAASPSSFGITFSAPVTPASATNTANYTLTTAGADGTLGTADDATVNLSGASYDPATRTVTLTTASPLPDDAYRITVAPGVVDPTGVPLNEGLAQSVSFDASATEPATNDTIATAVSTGLTPGVNGTYSLTTAVGNNAQAGKDVDLYSVPGVAGERLAARATRVGISGADELVRIYDASGNLLGSASTSPSNPSASVSILLAATGTYYVAVSSAANTTYNPATIGSGSAGSTGLYQLRVDVNNGIAVPPLNEGFEGSTLPGYITTYSSDATNGQVQLSTNVVHSGSQSLRLGDAQYGYYLDEATVTFDATALSHNDLSFAAYAYEYVGLYGLPIGQFTGHTNGDGASISVDGTHWYPLVDFLAAANAGKFSSYAWNTFNVDLSAAAAADGLTLTDHTQIRFSYYNYGYPYSSIYGLYIDDLKIASDLVGPTVVSATGSNQFVVSSTLGSLSVQFNKSLDATSAVNASDYLLQEQGPSGLFDASDAINYALTPTYDDATHTTTLAVKGVTGGLPAGIYRLRIVGAGATPLTDVGGIAFQNGVDQDITFAVFPPESPTNDTIETATATGIAASGGGYSTSAMLGNDTTDGTAGFGDADLYRIDAAAGELLYVRAFSGFGNPNLLLRLFDSSGKSVATLDGSTNDALLDHLVVPSSGTYYLGVSAADNTSYDPVGGGGGVGTTRGLYHLTIQVINPVSFPVSDGFESGSLNPAYWDSYITGAGDVYVGATSPLDGSFSALFGKLSNNAYGYAQEDLTLHANLSGVASGTPVQLRFLERNNGVYYSASTPSSYGLGRDVGTTGVYLSVDGSNFYLLDPSYFTSSNSTTGSIQRSINLTEFAANHGLTLGWDVEIRFSNYSYYYDGVTNTREIDDVQIVEDTFGPKLASVTADNNNASRTLLNDAASKFTLTFDSRLSPTLAVDTNSYALVYAGADGVFAGQAGDTGDDRSIPMTPTYDGNFLVTLAVDPGHLRLAPGRYELVVKGTGADALTDRYGNILNGGPGSQNGADTTVFYTVAASGPMVTASNPASAYYYNEATYSASAGFSTFTLTFNEAIQAGSFTGADVSITDQNGDVLVAPANITVAPASGDATGTLWVVSFPAIHAPGSVNVKVGPHVADLSGVEMNQNHDATNGQDPGDAYTFAVIVSDFSPAGYLVNLLDQGRYLYDIYTYNGELYNGGQLNSSGGQTQPSSYSGYDQFQVSTPSGTSSYYNPVYSYVNGQYAFAYNDSGQGVVLPNMPVGGLRVHREVYVPATGGDFARLLDVYSNPGTAPIVATVTLYGYLGSSSLTVVGSSSDGTGTFNPADTYFTTIGGGRLALGHLVMDGDGAAVVSSTSLSSGYATWSFRVTIPAGQTIRVMTIETQQATQAQAQSVASGLAGLPAEALANLGAAEKGSIVNFAAGDTIAPSVTSTTPSPASTAIAPVTQFVATFSERLKAATATSASNYTLLFAGPDGVLGTADDSTIAMTPTYNDAADQVTLAVAAGSSPLDTGLYRLTFSPSITDRAGNALGGGAAQVFEYTVFVSGPSVVGFTPDNTTAAGGWSSAVVAFDEAIAPASFTADEVRITDVAGHVLVDPSRIAIAHVDGDGTGRQWVVSFPTITDPGAYLVTIGPGIVNLAGLPMNQDGNTINGENPADDFTTEVIVSDSGSTTLADGQGYQYAINAYYGNLENSGTAVSGGAQSPYSALTYLYVDGNYYYNNTYDSATSNYAFAIRDAGQTLILPATPMPDGLRVGRSYFVPADGTGFARILDSFTNPGTTPINATVTFFGYLAAGSNTTVFADSNGDLVFDPTDNYLVTSDSGGLYAPVGHVIMDGDALTPSNTSLSSGSMQWSFSISVGPGQTVRLMTVETQQATASDAQAEAAVLAGRSDPREFAGLSDDVLGTLLNFATGFDSLAPYVSDDLSQPLFDNAGPITGLSLVFSKAVDQATASAPQNYSLVGAGPDGQLGTGDDVTYDLTPEFLDGTDVSLAIATAGLPVGLYSLTISPSILGVNGLALNGGTPQVFVFQVLHNGPSVIAATPDSTDPATGWSSLAIEFSEAIDPASFTADQVVITDQGTGTVVDSSKITIAPAAGDGTGRSWVVSFPTLFGPGSYRVKIGPHITDTLGVPMNQNGNISFGEDPSDAYFMYITVSDSSGTTLTDGGGFQYMVYPVYGDLSNGGYTDPSTGELTRAGSYSGANYLDISTPTGSQYYYNSSGAYQSTDGGRGLILPTEAIGGVLVHREILAPSDDQFLRYLDILTNPGGVPIHVTLNYYIYLGAGETQLIAESSRTGTFGATDTYLVVDDGSDTGGALTLGFVFMDGQGLATMTSAYYSQGSTYLDWTFSLTIAAGQTMLIMSLDTQQLNRTSALVQASRLVGLPSTVLADLPDATRATIVNFAAPSSGSGTSGSDPGNPPAEVVDLAIHDLSAPDPAVPSVPPLPPMYPMSGPAVDALLALVNRAAGTRVAQTPAKGLRPWGIFGTQP